jgi:endonuclease-3
MARESQAARKQRTLKIIEVLKATYPDAHCALEHRNAYELLVATILSAQCTDARVNMVTPVLFKKYPSPRELAGAQPQELEKLIQSTGFFRSKARSLRESATDIVAKHGGEVPQTMEQLTDLRGVGRKTANVVLGNAFGQNVGVVVDTHVTRVSNRLGLTAQENAVKIESDLMPLVPQEDWTLFSHLLIFHGRQICIARKPKCEQCPLLKHCPTGPKLIAEGLSAGSPKPAKGRRGKAM